MFLIHSSPENAEIVARAVTSACRLEGGRRQPRARRDARILRRSSTFRIRSHADEPRRRQAGRPQPFGPRWNRTVVDFFQHANEPLEETRARFGIQPKSAKILELDPFGVMKLPP